MFRGLDPSYLFCVTVVVRTSRIFWAVLRGNPEPLQDRNSQRWQPFLSSLVRCSDMFGDVFLLLRGKTGLALWGCSPNLVWSFHANHCSGCYGKSKPPVWSSVAGRISLFREMSKHVLLSAYPFEIPGFGNSAFRF